MKRLTKKDLALSLHASGRTVEEIARSLDCSPTYVANVLAANGKPSDYSDLYTSSTAQNEYARMFRGALRFSEVDAARASVARIDILFHEFEARRDRRGQHQAQLIALIGKNRAEGIGKIEEAKLFRDWLVDHLEIKLDEGSGSDPRSRNAIDADESSPYDLALAFA